MLRPIGKDIHFIPFKSEPRRNCMALAAASTYTDCFYTLHLDRETIELYRFKSINKITVIFPVANSDSDILFGGGEAFFGGAVFDEDVEVGHQAEGEVGGGDAVEFAEEIVCL